MSSFTNFNDIGRSLRNDDEILVEFATEQAQIAREETAWERQAAKELAEAESSRLANEIKRAEAEATHAKEKA